jgi:hypothetical protein
MTEMIQKQKNLPCPEREQKNLPCQFMSKVAHSFATAMPSLPWESMKLPDYCLTLELLMMMFSGDAAKGIKSFSNES